MLHAEEFTEFATRGIGFEQIMVERFARTRIGGRLQSENFEVGLSDEMLNYLGVIPGTNGIPVALRE